MAIERALRRAGDVRRTAVGQRVDHGGGGGGGVGGGGGGKCSSQLTRLAEKKQKKKQKRRKKEASQIQILQGTSRTSGISLFPGKRKGNADPTSAWLLLVSSITRGEEGARTRRELEGRKEASKGAGRKETTAQCRFFNSIPLGLVIVQLVQLGLAEGEAEAETESIREREEGERGKKNEKEKEENSRTLYPPTYLQRLQ